MSAQKQPAGFTSITQSIAKNPADELNPVGTNSSAGHTASTSQATFPAPANHRYLEALFTNTPSTIVAIDNNFRIFDMNPAATTALGCSREVALGQHCNQLLKCRNLNGTVLCGTSSCLLTRVMRQKQPIVHEEVIIGIVPDHSHEFDLGVTPVDQGSITGAIFAARNVSNIKVANRVRANFVSMVSHELRTPLNSVHGFIDLLLQGQMGELTEEQHKYLGYAQEGVQQLVSIVEDILLMTRSDSGQFEIKQQEVDLHELVNQVVNGLQPQALKAGVALNKDITTLTSILYVDPQRMKQVLNNLVTNAIKFTPPGGTVTIRVRPYNERFVMISVSDTGYGIPVEDRPHIFERFYQSNHALQSKMGGYGLGLPIAKLIVEQHGGEISFDSAIDKGTTFYFTVPFFT
jgi:PAS domain S-box-containing protein